MDFFLLNQISFITAHYTAYYYFSQFLLILKRNKRHNFLFIKYEKTCQCSTYILK